MSIKEHSLKPAHLPVDVPGHQSILYVYYIYSVGLYLPRKHEMDIYLKWY